MRMLEGKWRHLCVHWRQWPYGVGFGLPARSYQCRCKSIPAPSPFCTAAATSASEPCPPWSSSKSLRPKSGGMSLEGCCMAVAGDGDTLRKSLKSNVLPGVGGASANLFESVCGGLDARASASCARSERAGAAGRISDAGMDTDTGAGVGAGADAGACIGTCVAAANGGAGSSCVGIDSIGVGGVIVGSRGR